MVQNVFAPVTPGEMLKDEFLAEYRLSQNRPAKAIGIRRTALLRSSTTDDGKRRYRDPTKLAFRR